MPRTRKINPERNLTATTRLEQPIPIIWSPIPFPKGHRDDSIDFFPIRFSCVLISDIYMVIPSLRPGHRPMSDNRIVVCPIPTPVFVRWIERFSEEGKGRLSILGRCSTHRTNTGPGIRQTATRVSDRSRYRRLAVRITVCGNGGRVRLRGEILKEEGSGEVARVGSSEERS